MKKETKEIIKSYFIGSVIDSFYVTSMTMNIGFFNSAMKDVNANYFWLKTTNYIIVEDCNRTKEHEIGSFLDSRENLLPTLYELIGYEVKSILFKNETGNLELLFENSKKLLIFEDYDEAEDQEDIWGVYKNLFEKDEKKDWIFAFFRNLGLHSNDILGSDTVLKIY